MVVALCAGAAAAQEPAQDASQAASQEASNPVIEAARQGITLDREGRYAEALPLLERSYPELVAHLPAGDRWRLNTAFALGHSLVWLDRSDDAIAVLSAADAAVIAAGADTAPDAPDIAYALAMILNGSNRIEEAQAAARRACTLWAMPERNADPALCARLDPVLARSAAPKSDRPVVHWNPPAAEADYNAALRRALDAADGGRPDEADAAVLEALAIEAVKSDADDLERARSQEFRAAVLMKGRRWRQAADVWAEVVNTRRRLSGALHADTVDAVTRLGQTYEQAEAYAEADAVYLRWLADVEAERGPDDLALAKPLQALGGLYRLTGREAEAEPLWRRALALRETAGEGEGRDAAVIRGNLALSIQTQGRLVEAEAIQRSLLAWKEAHPDLDPTLKMLTASNLGVNLISQGRFQEAEPLLRLAIDLPPGETAYDRRTRGTAFSNLSIVLVAQGRLAEADAILAQGLAAFGAGYDPAQNRILQGNLAALRTAQGRGDEAEDIMRAIAVESEAALGLDHADTAAALSNLASILEERGQAAGAEVYYRRALESATAALGADHPFTRRVSLVLAINLLNQGKTGEARPMFETTLAQTAATPNDPLRPMALSGLASILEDTDHEVAAEPLLREALALRRVQLGEASTRTAESWELLAANLGNQGRYDEAREAVGHAAVIYQAALAPGHPDRLEMALLLAATEERDGAPAVAMATLRGARSDYLLRAGGSALRGQAAEAEIEQARPLFRRSVRVAWTLAH
jgi:Tfp pilus assembly protein PilF